MIAAVVNMIKPAAPALPATGSDGEGVVVLCRDMSVRDLVATWLTQAGLDMRVAHDGHDARRLLASTAVTAQTLITDRVFPPWPGLDSILRLKQELPGVRVVLIQDSSVDAVAMAEAAGADAGLSRPLNRATLFDVMDIDAREGA